MIYRLTIEIILAAASQSSVRPISNPESIVNDAIEDRQYSARAYFG
jgi:hypothetical protein